MTNEIMTGAAVGGNDSLTPEHQAKIADLASDAGATSTEDVAPQDETAAIDEVPPGDTAEPLPQDIDFEALTKGAIDPVAAMRVELDKLTARVEKLEADTAAYHASLEAAGIVRPFTMATVDEPPPQGQ